MERMARSRLGWQVALLVVGLVALNAAAWLGSRNTVPRALVRAGKARAGATDLFLGNSLVAAGVDEQAFSGAAPGRTAFNGGLGSSYPLEHLLLFQQWPHLPSRAVHYGYFATQLTALVEGSFETLKGNRTLVYDHLGEALPHLGLGPLHALGLRVAGAVPLVVDRGAIWARVERLRRALGETGMPKAATGRFGRIGDFEGMDALGVEPTGQAPREAGLSGPIRSLVDQARRRGLAVYLVRMPLSARRREQLGRLSGWAEYQARTEALVRELGATPVSCEDWVDDGGFEDGLHLSPEGARAFSARYALALASSVAPAAERKATP